MAALILHTPSGQNLVLNSVPLYTDLIDEVEKLLGITSVRLSCRNTEAAHKVIDSEEALREVLETENIPLHLDVVREGERCLYCEGELGDSSQCVKCGTEDWDVWLMSKHGVEVWVHYTGAHSNREEQVPLMEDYSGEDRHSQLYEELPESPLAVAEPKGGESGCESDIEGDIEADNEEEAETPSSKPGSQRDYPSVPPSIVDLQPEIPVPRRSVPFSSPYLQSGRSSKSYVPPAQTLSSIPQAPASIEPVAPTCSETALPLSMPRPLPQPALSRLCEKCWLNVPWYLPSCTKCDARESLTRLAPGAYKAKIQSYL